MKQFIFEQLKFAQSEHYICEQIFSSPIPFDHNILLWHIATDLCYYTDLEKYLAIPTPDSKYTFGKLVSNYLMHIIVPGYVCSEATKVFEKRSIISGSSGKGRARQVLLEVNTEADPERVIGNISKTILFAWCRLAKQLQSLE
ncbi:hypothetical protein ACE6H2_026654 [Prunus campanulata]